MSVQTNQSDRRGIERLPESLPLRHGGVIAEPRLAWREMGAPAGTPVLVLGGISAGRDLDLWWPTFIGEGEALDTSRHRLLGIDYLGGAGESSGPLGRDGALRRIDAEDQARAIARHLDAIGLERLHAIVGASYGGQAALAFAALYPARVESLVLLVAAHRAHPMASAWRSLQRRIVRHGLAHGGLAEATSIARGFGMATYRSEEEFEGRFGHAPEWRDGQPHFPVESYLEARGRSFLGRFTPEALLCLSESIDLSFVEPRSITTPMTLVSVRTDQLVPPWLVEELARESRGPSRHVTVESLYGHDGFLKERASIGGEIHRALNGEG